MLRTSTANEVVILGVRATYYLIKHPFILGTLNERPFRPKGNIHVNRMVPPIISRRREAVLADTRRSTVLDSVRLEGYQRLNDGYYIPGAFPFPHGKRYALTLSRDFSHRFNFDSDYDKTSSANPVKDLFEVLAYYKQAER